MAPTSGQRPMSSPRRGAQNQQKGPAEIWELCLARDLLNRAQSNLLKATFYKSFFLALVALLEFLEEFLEGERQVIIQLTS